MTKLGTHHILSISHLLSIGAGSNFVRTSTVSLGNAIGRSQQSASAYLTELEAIGYAKRNVQGGKTYVMITKKCVLEIKRVSAALSKALYSKNTTGMLLAGKISSGVGEGAYYMSLKEYVVQFREKIGYVPYPGTLNIMLDERSSTNMLNILTTKEPDAMIDGFSDGKRTYGWVKCYKCLMNGKKCHLVRLERTHHEDKLVEIISKINLRRTCKMHDGSSAGIIFTD